MGLCVINNGVKQVLQMILFSPLLTLSVLGLSISTLTVWFHREKLEMKNVRQVVSFCAILLICSLVSVFLFSAFENLLAGEKPSGAASMFGGFLFGPPIIYVITRVFKLDAKGTFDLFALFACPTLFVSRCACLINGCCKGKMIYGLEIRWPTREIELLFYVIMLVVLWRMDKKNSVPGQLAPLLMATYGCARFVIEFFREGTGGVFHIAHLWSIVCVILGFSVFFEIRQTARKKSSSRKGGYSRG